MKSPSIYHCLSLSILSLTLACSEATFSGSNKSKARLDDSTPGSDVLSCTASPEVVKVGQPVALAITNPAGGKVYQTISIGDESQAAELQAAGGAYVRAGGGDNSFIPVKEGAYAVALRLAAQGPVLGNCSFSASLTGEPPVVPPTTPNTTPGATPGPGTPTTKPQDPTNPSPTPPAPTPAPTTPPTTEEPICKDNEISIGAHVAFLIDNSNSNAATDCTSPKQLREYINQNGERTGTFIYECQAATNREKAVLSAFEVLKSVASREAQNADANSRLAVASFPTERRVSDGYQISGMGWFTTKSSSNEVANGLAFTRTPFGLTPYGAGLAAASELFANLPNDGRSRVAVLVTDGEPTDRDPEAVKSLSNSLKSRGVELITVYVTQAQTRQKRYEDHVNMMSRLNGGSESWYNTNKYKSFDAYIDSLLGTTNGLIAKISNQVVEVDNSAALEKAFKQIIKTKAIKCQQAR